MSQIDTLRSKGLPRHGKVDRVSSVGEIARGDVLFRAQITAQLDVRANNWSRRG